MRSQKFVSCALLIAAAIVIAACTPVPAGFPPSSAATAPSAATSSPTQAMPGVSPVLPAAIDILTPTISAAVTATAEISPTLEAPVQASPVVTETQTATPVATLEMTTYRDELAGFQFDYPVDWALIDATPEIKEESLGYSITLMSWQPEEPGGEGILDGGSKVDVNVTKGTGASPEEAIEARRQEISAGDPGSEITFEEPWELADGLAAVHWTIQPSTGDEVHEVVTAINGNRIVLSGIGDPALFEQIAATLLPAPVAAAAAAAAAKQVEQEPPSTDRTAANPTPETTDALAATLYTVRQGDTLTKIAARYGVAVSAILRANPRITNPDRIYVGQRIVIPSPTPKPPPAVTRINIYMIGLDSGDVGCGDEVVPVRRDIPKTPAPLTAALNLLFAQRSQYYGQSGLYNALYQSNLQIASISRSGSDWTIRLTGSLVLGGVCDNPRVKAQLEQTALQFSTVKNVRYFVNGQPLESLLSGQ